MLTADGEARMTLHSNSSYGTFQQAWLGVCGKSPVSPGRLIPVRHAMDVLCFTVGDQTKPRHGMTLHDQMNADCTAEAHSFQTLQGCIQPILGMLSRGSPNLQRYCPVPHGIQWGQVRDVV